MTLTREEIEKALRLKCAQMLAESIVSVAESKLVMVQIRAVRGDMREYNSLLERSLRLIDHALAAGDVSRECERRGD